MSTGALIVRDGQYLTVVDLIRFVLDWDEKRAVSAWKARAAPNDVECWYKLKVALNALDIANIGIRPAAWAGHMVVNAEVFRAWALAWRRAWVVEALCRPER